ncbi:MAG TPA: PQQ-dependent sugar dehydrogenase [Bellilinea sp.]|nr:PQQ-dependent sugar dehydrogenase [Bellilinea sp.]
MRIKWILTIVFISLFFKAGTVLARQPELQGPPQNETTIYLPLVMRSLPLPPPDEADQRLTLPDGFAIRIYAQGINGAPRFMTIGPDGHLYVSLFGSGQIARLPDRNLDGLADGIEIIASGLSGPHGIEFNGAYLYVASIGKVERLPGPDGNGAFGPKELVTDKIPGSGGHSTRTLHFGPDGKLYVSAGSSCNFCVETDPRRAAILRFNPDGTIPADNPFANDPVADKRPVWAYGLRNSVDFLWSPGGQLWADHMGSDALGDDIPPEEIVIPVQKGLSHGWPYCYTPTLGVNNAAEVRDDRLELPSGFTCDQAVAAKFTAPAHSAPLGMTLGSGSNFPPAYRSSLYVAFHGSWNTTAASIRDCKVERVILENGQPVGSETFASGWRAPGETCGAAATYGRPADVFFGPRGEMFISDDKSGRVYRVIYQP